MSNILAIFSAVKEFIALIKFVVSWIKQLEAEKAIKEGEKKVDAISDAQKATTPQEAHDAQKSVNNSTTS